jgi:hypothetical protein
VICAWKPERAPVDDLRAGAALDALEVRPAGLEVAVPVIVQRATGGTDLVTVHPVHELLAAYAHCRLLAPLRRLLALRVASRQGSWRHRGWVTGVLFEAWRVGPHVEGAGGEADPVDGYRAACILD